MDIFQQLTNLVGQGAAPRQAQQGGAGGLEGLLNPSMLSGLIGSLLGGRGGAGGGGMGGGMGAAMSGMGAAPSGGMDLGGLLGSLLGGGGASLLGSLLGGATPPPAPQAAATGGIRIQKKNENVLRALVYAARADGSIDSQEEASINEQVQKLGLGQDAQEIVNQALSEQMDPGRIAAKMAHTLRDMYGARLYAVASRDRERAGAFAARWGAERAYGSYEEMLDDPALDLVYISTPHTLHRENALLAIRKGKPVLCEKPFTVNTPEAEEVIGLAREKGVFVAEAIWTRYLPMSQTINEIVASGVIGAPLVLSANLGYPVTGKERIWDPALAGGALLDVGVYPINFASMVFGTEIEHVVSSCTKLPSGVDASNSISITFSGGRLAVLHSSIVARTDRQGIISGDLGHIIVENVNNPACIPWLWQGSPP